MQIFSLKKPLGFWIFPCTDSLLVTGPRTTNQDQLETALEYPFIAPPPHETVNFNPNRFHGTSHFHKQKELEFHRITTKRDVKDYR